MPSFAHTLSHHQLDLTRAETHTLQVNVGLVCNMACKHCHLEAGPHREEVMDRETVEEVVAYAERAGFSTVDITGGAPELNPHIEDLIQGLAGLEPARRILFRANLTALAQPERAGLRALLAHRGVNIVASLPALNQGQADGQRGAGSFQTSLDSLGLLNELGYGREGSGLELDLVCNPTGAFLPAEQGAAEKRFRDQLARRWGLVFNHLYAFANVPLGRYRAWLERSGNYEAYLDGLVKAFNPCSVEGLMCRHQVSVAWDGLLYDCDFNLAAGIPLAGEAGVHLRDLEGPPAPGLPIGVGEHCYTCTAGAGFT